MQLDIAIIGGGPAGWTCALQLARTGLHIGVIDSLDWHRHKVGESVPSALQRLLCNISIPLLESPAHMPILGTESYWAGEHLIEDCMVQAGGAGWRLDRVVFEKMLMAQALEAGAIHFDALLHRAHRGSDIWQLSLDNGEQVFADFAIDCSGRTNILARRVGAKRVKAPPLVAIWSLLPGEPQAQRASSSHTYIESQDSGWWYAAKLPDGRWLAIFHTSAVRVRDFRMAPELWQRQLASTQLISQHLPEKAPQCAELSVSDARTSYLEVPSGESWAACGDAAISFDPISSQGIYNAVATANMLSKVLCEGSRGEAFERYQHNLAEIRRVYIGRRQAFYLSAFRVHRSQFWLTQNFDPTTY
ncbi:NAD(P)/FAD-dependent oxidoreductase [Microbulbifer sp. SSSA002]|uniref:NAD(P)/FAD-dependent oxidoreductase n=1 Tax=Microbulbifer sp. SSSA002 TaxID=3243376 RepID=UPI004039787A